MTGGDEGAVGVGGADGPEDPPTPVVADATTGSTAASTTPASGRGPIRLFLLGFVLLVAGGVATWAQDALAPFVNLGEAPLPGPIVFDADDATYRVVTSGPGRPGLEFTACIIERADGTTVEDYGVDGAEGAQEHFGVTRVLEFDAVAGRTEVRCGSKPSARDTPGRFQIVAARGPVTLATYALFAAGGTALVAAIGWFAWRVRAAAGSA